MKPEPRGIHKLIHDFLRIHLPLHRNASDDTIRAYAQAIDQFRIYMRDIAGIPFSALQVDHFDAEHIQEFLSSQRNEKGLSAATVNLRLAALKSFLRYCGEQDVSLYSLYQQSTRIHRFREDANTAPKHLTEAQMKALLEAPDTSRRIGRRDQFLILLTYQLGVRLREVLSLTLQNISFDAPCTRIRVCGKGSKVRWIPLLSDVQPNLEAYLNEFHPLRTPDELLFYTVHGGRHTPMTGGTVQYMLRKYAKQIRQTDPEFPLDLHAHMLRHSIGMSMYTNGVPISYIRDFLGHVNVQTTGIYAHADDKTIRQALEAVPSASVTSLNVQPVWEEREAELLAYCGFREPY